MDVHHLIILRNLKIDAARLFVKGLKLYESSTSTHPLIAERIKLYRSDLERIKQEVTELDYRILNIT